MTCEPPSPSRGSASPTGAAWLTWGRDSPGRARGGVCTRPGHVEPSLRGAASTMHVPGPCELGILADGPGLLQHCPESGHGHRGPAVPALTRSLDFKGNPASLASEGCHSPRPGCCSH